MVLPVVEVKVTADTAQATANLNSLGKEVSSVPAKAQKASKASGVFAGSLKRMGNVSRQTRAQIQNTSFQLQDMAVQLEMGTSLSRTLSQQLPQLAGGFGAVGAAVGVLAAVGIPILTASFAALNEETASFDDIIENVDSALGDYKKAIDAADVSTGALKDRFGEVTPEVLEFAQALLGVASGTAAKAVDDLALSVSDLVDSFSEGRRSLAGIAGTFDLNVGFVQPFVDGSREFRDFSKEAATAFLETQQAIKISSGNLELQAALLGDLLRQAEKLADVSGDRSDKERELIAQIARAGQAVQRQIKLNMDLASAYDDVIGSEEGLAASVEALNDLYEERIGTIDLTAGAYIDVIGSEAGLGQAVAANNVLFAERLRLMAAADPLDAFGGAGRFIPQLMDPFVPSGGGGGAGGGGDGRLEGLIESLQTEQEVIDQWRADGLEALASASETELEALGGINEAKLRLEQEYQDRLAGIKSKGRETDLSMTLGAGADVLSALGAFNDKAFKLAKVAAAAQALVSTFQGSAEALKLPFPENLAAAASVMAKGLGLVAAIKGVSSSGGGGAGGGGAGAAAAAAPAQSPLNVRLSGLGAGDSITGGQLSSLFDRLQDEAGDRGLNVSFAT